MNPIKSSLHSKLRIASKIAHHDLDHHPLLLPLVSLELTMDEYARALAALHAPQAALERLLDGFVPTDRFPPRLPALEADLQRLGQAPYPLKAQLPHVNDADEKLGIMYLLEGSQLGGAVIARQLQKNSLILPEQHFFAACLEQPRWGAFWHFADQHCTLEGMEKTIAATINAFSFMKHHLDACLKI